MILKKMRRDLPTPFLRALIFGIGSLVLIGGVAALLWPAPAPTQFGIDTVIALASSTHAEIVQLKPSPEFSQELGVTEPGSLFPSRKSKANPHPARRPIRHRKRTLEAWMSSTPKTVDAEWRRSVQRLLTRRTSFRMGVMPACMPMPGVAIRFSGGQDPVDVLICFHCKMISIAPPGRPRWGYGEPCIRELLTLVRQQFPDDPELAEIMH
jgi:hypothetical protein